MIQVFGCKKAKGYSKGMTLLELLVVVTVIGFLATVAYPNYSRHALKTHRSVAQADLMRLQLQLEQTYNRFAGENNGYDFSLLEGGQCLLCESEAGRYRFTVSPDNIYTLTATPVKDGPQRNDNCGTLTLDAAGRTEPQRCWR